MSRLTATDALRISRKHVKTMNAIEYKRFVKSIMDEYGLEKNDAFSLVQGNNVLEIVAKYEKMPNKTNEEWRRICSKEDFAKFICHLLKGNDLYLGSMSLKSLIQNAEKQGKDGVAEVQAWLQEEHDMSNEEWFNGLSITKKAKWFCDHITCSDGCPFYKQCLDEDMGRELWQKWLLEEHREM